MSQQYILSGSDDFNLYMWRIPADPEAGEYIPGMKQTSVNVVSVDNWHAVPLQDRSIAMEEDISLLT